MKKIINDTYDYKCDYKNDKNDYKYGTHFTETNIPSDSNSQNK